MTKKIIFTGIATALITPFKDNGIDFDKYGKIIDWQIECGIDALLVCGTTGEGSTLTDSEHRSVIEFAVDHVNGRVPVIAGTGSNDTEYAVSLTRFAEKIGADAALSVTPYYNKATQKGLVRHFSTIADKSGIPMIVYNVPSRTGTNIEPETYAELAKHERIVAIKEASGNIEKIVDTMSRVSGELTLYSGNDGEIVPLMAVGAMGCISVLSNILPAETREICSKFFAGDIKGSAELQFKYKPLIDSLFSEVNPIPVKAAMAAMGFCEPDIRMPLTEMDDLKFAKMTALMKAAGISL